MSGLTFDSSILMGRKLSEMKKELRETQEKRSSLFYVIPCWLPEYSWSLILNMFWEINNNTPFEDRKKKSQKNGKLMCVGLSHRQDGAKCQVASDTKLASLHLMQSPSKESDPTGWGRHKWRYHLPSLKMDENMASVEQTFSKFKPWVKDVWNSELLPIQCLLCVSHSSKCFIYINSCIDHKFLSLNPQREIGNEGHSWPISMFPKFHHRITPSFYLFHTIKRGENNGKHRWKNWRNYH